MRSSTREKIAAGKQLPFSLSARKKELEESTPDSDAAKHAPTYIASLCNSSTTNYRSLKPNTGEPFSSFYLVVARVQVHTHKRHTGIAAGFSFFESPDGGGTKDNRQQIKLLTGHFFFFFFF